MSMNLNEKINTSTGYPWLKVQKREAVVRILGVCASARRRCGGAGCNKLKPNINNIQTAKNGPAGGDEMRYDVAIRVRVTH